MKIFCPVSILWKPADKPPPVVVFMDTPSVMYIIAPDSARSTCPGSNETVTICMAWGFNTPPKRRREPTSLLHVPDSHFLQSWKQHRNQWERQPLHRNFFCRLGGDYRLGWVSGKRNSEIPPIEIEFDFETQ
mmetsp:Transcript_29061/g.67406  ORF Transcript_29061/g.67406 Transcript_29061/m.67406 type:complete len:132 (-) Transcript_29061:95-490(-)